jgi:uncharacterized protein with FMN-binding domain
MEPRRGAIALTITTLALSLLFSFRAREAAATTATTNRAVVAAAGVSTTTATGAGASGASAAATATTTATGVGADGTWTGDSFSTRWGNVQVTVTIRNGVISDVAALSYPANDNHSAQLNAQVVPRLRTAVLAAQSSSVDGVSGATYTSNAYISSVQSALDAAAAAA